jgi:hypothetical protein
MGHYVKKAAVTTFMGNTLAKTLVARSESSSAILHGIEEIFEAYQRMINLCFCTD